MASYVSCGFVTSVLNDFMPKDRWFTVQDAYAVVRRNSPVGKYDRVFGSWGNHPRWQHNIRCALYRLKKTGALVHHKGRYIYAESQLSYPL